MNISQTSLVSSFTGSQVARKVARFTWNAIKTSLSSVEPAIQSGGKIFKKLPSPYIMPESVPSARVVKYGSGVYFIKRGNLLFPLQGK